MSAGLVGIGRLQAAAAGGGHGEKAARQPRISLLVEDFIVGLL